MELIPSQGSICLYQVGPCTVIIIPSIPLSRIREVCHACAYVCVFSLLQTMLAVQVAFHYKSAWSTFVIHIGYWLSI